MLRVPSSLIAGALLLGAGMSILGGASASASPQQGQWVVGRPATADLNPVQYDDDGGRCFNTCIAGNIFRRCQVDSEGERENCCNRVCNRFNNWRY